VVVAGDFNDTPGSRTWTAMAEQFDDVWLLAGAGDGFTFPSTGPDRRIDYIWLGKGAPLRPLRSWVPRTGASDHLPLVVELVWERQRARERATSR
jgi:endonuclease/exonuclease/phosphatase family metal-dependent hydrolase